MDLLRVCPFGFAACGACSTRHYSAKKISHVFWINNYLAHFQFRARTFLSERLQNYKLFFEIKQNIKKKVADSHRPLSVVIYSFLFAFGIKMIYRKQCSIFNWTLQKYKKDLGNVPNLHFFVHQSANFFLFYNSKTLKIWFCVIYFGAKNEVINSHFTNKF